MVNMRTIKLEMLVECQFEIFFLNNLPTILLINLRLSSTTRLEINIWLKDTYLSTSYTARLDVIWLSPPLGQFGTSSKIS